MNIPITNDVATAALMIFALKEIFFFVRSMNGKSPTNQAAKLTEEAIERQTKMMEMFFIRQDALLDKINEKVSHSHNLLERCHDKMVAR